MERKLAGILCADVYGYSRVMGQDEYTMHRTLAAYRTMLDSDESHRERFAKPANSSSRLIEAVNCTVDIQNDREAENKALPQSDRLDFRISINSG